MSHFTGFGLKIFWTVIYNMLDLKILGLRIWITIIIVYGIWTLKQLVYGFGFQLLFMLLN